MTPKKSQYCLTSEEAESKVTSIKEQSAKNAYHIEILNHEVGELRDAQHAANTKLDSLDVKVDGVGIAVAGHSNDLGWIKKIGYVAITGLIAILAGIGKLIFHTS